MHLNRLGTISVLALVVVVMGAAVAANEVGPVAVEVVAPADSTRVAGAERGQRISHAPGAQECGGLVYLRSPT